jgi:hypothetical protein
MKRLSDDDLILFRYGESPDPEGVRAALAADPALAERYAELERLLSAVDLADAPEPPAGFEEGAWRRLRPALATARRGGPLAQLLAALPRRFPALAPIGAALLLVALGFLVGRGTGPGPDDRPVTAAEPGPEAFPLEARERILRASVAGHLGSSERLLTELVNRPEESVTPPDEIAFAQALLDSNRLYRRAAERAGERRIVDLLDRLEPVLLELAHAPAGSPPRDPRGRAENEDLLFRIRIVGSRLAAQRPPVRPASTTSQL